MKLNFSRNISTVTKRRVTHRDGFKYAITFVDDYSSYIFVNFLKQKSDASNALKKFLADSSPYGKVSEMKFFIFYFILLGCYG